MLYKGSLQYTLGNQYQKGRRKAGIVAGSSGNEAVWCVMRGQSSAVNIKRPRGITVCSSSLFACTCHPPCTNREYRHTFALCSTGITLVHVSRSRPSVEYSLCRSSPMGPCEKREIIHVTIFFFFSFLFKKTRNLCLLNYCRLVE